MGRLWYPVRVTVLWAAVCSALSSVPPAWGAPTADSLGIAPPWAVAASVQAQQLERAVQRRQLASAATPEAESLFARALRPIRAQLPDSLLRCGPGMQRLLRERLAADLGPLANASAEVWSALLPDDGRLPAAAVAATSTLGSEPCTPARAEPSQMLLDLLVVGSTAITRGEDGVQIEVRDLTCRHSARTEVVGTRPSEYAANRQQEGNAVYARLQTDLTVALADLQVAEANERSADSGFLTFVSLLLARGTVNDIRKQLADTPPYTYVPVYAPYMVELTQATARTTVFGTVVVNDPATGWRASVNVEGLCERTGPGLRGVRSGDRNACRETDALAELPSQPELLAAAFNDFRAGAAVRVLELAGQAALRRAARVNKPGRGGEALGYLLIARDCGEPAARGGRYGTRARGQRDAALPPPARRAAAAVQGGAALSYFGSRMCTPGPIGQPNAKNTSSSVVHSTRNTTE